MPKIIYEDGREVEINIVGGAREVGNEEYFKFTIVDRSGEKLREMLTQVMQSRQVANLLPYEIVQGMLLTMGNSEFAEDLTEIIKEARDSDNWSENSYHELPEKLTNKFLRKWGLRN